MRERFFSLKKVLFFLDFGAKYGLAKGTTSTTASGPGVKLALVSRVVYTFGQSIFHDANLKQRDAENTELAILSVSTPFSTLYF